MSNITLHERLILTDLMDKPKTACELSNSSSLELNVVRNILSCLIDKNLLQKETHHYHIPKKLSTEQLKDLQSEELLKVEKSIILESIIDKSEHQNFKRISLSQKDYKMFKGMLKNIDIFLEGAKMKSENIKDELIFYWGFENYGKIAKRTLNF